MVPSGHGMQPPLSRLAFTVSTLGGGDRDNDMDDEGAGCMIITSDPMPR